jgi:hypothetical protein
VKIEYLKMFEAISGIDLTIIIILLSAFLLFFGRIGSPNEEHHDKLGYYITGLQFSLRYIFIPVFLVYSILYNKTIFRVSAIASILIFLQFVIYICLSFTRGLYTSVKYGSLNEIKKIMESNLVKLFRITKNSEFSDSYQKVLSGLLSETPIKLFGNSIALFIFSFITILSSMWLYKSQEALTWISLVLTFYILTMVAIAYRFKNEYYPLATVYLDDGTVIEGEILRSADYVYIKKDDKYIFINKDKIKYLEETKKLSTQ